MAYAKRLTKERLIQEGFTEITKEGRLFKGDQEVFPHWNGKETNPNRYLCIMLSKRDSEGHLIKGKERIFKYTRKDGSIGECNSWGAVNETFGLHRIMWAWHYGEVPEGMVVDHINNQHARIEDYRLDNLQLLTPKENLAKEREESIREMKCSMKKPLSYYEEKLINFEALYEKAKQEHNADLCHSLRGNISQTRARIRYWNSHKEEYFEYIKQTESDNEHKVAKKQSIKDRKILEQYKDMFRKNGNKNMWHQLCDIINKWDTLESMQKKHVFEVLNKHFTLAEQFEY